MIDAQGFRPNVGIVIANDDGRLLWARRVGGRDAWQFPQGGVQEGEKPEDALYRELEEEVGLAPDAVSWSPAPAAGCATACRSATSARVSSRCASARSRNGFCCACSHPMTRSA
jgi:8-oxo-dGTP pyrophosphatase MutT (NUDIX family)